MRVTAVVLFVLAACSQRVYSPPSQAFSVTPVATLPAGRQTIAFEVARHSAIFDPAIDSAGGRYRVGINTNTEATVEGTALVVREPGPSTANRDFYMSRAAIRHNPNGDVNFSVFAGAGGGYSPSAGGFAALDAGIGLGIQNCTLVPVLQGSAFLSQPLDARPVDVSDTPEYQDYDTPELTLGYTVRAGLRLSLSPSACRRGEEVPWLYGGIGGTRVSDSDSNSAYIGSGFGLEIPF